MEYIVYKRFRGAGIDGEFNLRYGTVVSEIKGFLLTGQENGYWKNRLRTASTSRLKQIYAEKIGGKACILSQEKERLTDTQTV